MNKGNYKKNHFQIASENNLNLGEKNEKGTNS